MKFNPFCSYLIGLDIQPQEIRLVKLRKLKRRFQIDCAHKEPLPAHIFNHGKIEHFEVLSGLVAKIVTHLKLRGLAAAISLPANLVRMHEIQVPQGLSEAQIEAEIYASLQQELIGMPEALYFDYTEKHDTHGFSKIVFAATRQAYLSQFIQCVNAAGLVVKIVDVESYALQRIMTFNLATPCKAMEIYCLLHVTQLTVKLIGFDNENILFQQEWFLKDEKEFIALLKNKLQIAAHAFPSKSIKKLLVCQSINIDIDNLSKALKLSVIAINPFEPLCDNFPNPSHEKNMKISAFADDAHRFDFLLACGLAMRDEPIW